MLIFFIISVIIRLVINMNYITNFTPHIPNYIDEEYLSTIELKCINKESLSKEEINYLLSTIIYIVRYKINKNLDNYDYKCDLAQSILYYYFKNLNCNIYPSTTQNAITSSIIGHSFLTLEITVDNQTKYYLLDPTYIQFFKQSNCNKEKYYINPKYPDHILLTPDPGFFIQESMKQQCILLLNNGFIELTEDIAKMYGDSFYNTKTGTDPKTLTFQSIPGDIYLKSFIKGKEKLSKTTEELLEQNLYIKPFYLKQKSKSK